MPSNDFKSFVLLSKAELIFHNKAAGTPLHDVKLIEETMLSFWLTFRPSHMLSFELPPPPHSATKQFVFPRILTSEIYLTLDKMLPTTDRKTLGLRELRTATFPS